MAPPKPSAAKEPKPLPGLPAFEEGDFHALSDSLSRDAQYNDRRLVARRKLGAIGKEALVRIEASLAGSSGAGLDLITRTSLHQPHTFNGNRVRRLWAYLCRGKQAKAHLRKVLGRDLAKDLDAAYRNAYLCVALESEVIEVSFRIHSDGWYDGQNLVNRTQREGLDGWLEQLNALDGWFLQLADWKGEWRCGELNRDRLKEFLDYYQPGDHLLSVSRRFPAPLVARAHVFGPEVPGMLAGELLRLVPLYRYSAWSDESDFLFSS